MDSSDAASRPSTQDVAWYVAPRRARSGPGRRLAEDQADPGRRRGPALAAAVGVGVGDERVQPRRTGQPDERGRGPLPQAPQVLAEPGVDRAVGAAVEPLDEAADEADGLLEGDPRIALAPLLGRGQLHVAGRDVEVAGPAGRRRQAAGRQDRVEEGQPQRREDRGRAQVRLDAVDDRGQADELPRRVQVQQLVHELRRAVDGREPRLDDGPDLVGPDVRAEPDEVLGIERCLANLGLAALVATDRAAIDAGDRPPGQGRRRPR